MVNGFVVPSDTAEPVQELAFGSLEDYQAAIGGWIEPVDIPDLGITAYVNEEGLLKQLPLNSRLTFLWWYHVPQARQRAMLVGNAVVVGKANRAGESTDVPLVARRVLDPRERFRIEVRPLGAYDWHHDERLYPYTEATVWAMLITERSFGHIEVRITRVP